MAPRGHWATRQMPAILDHAAKNHVLEVREMLEASQKNFFTKEIEDKQRIRLYSDEV